MTCIFPPYQTLVTVTSVLLPYNQYACFLMHVKIFASVILDIIEENKNFNLSLNRFVCNCVWRELFRFRDNWGFLSVFVMFPLLCHKGIGSTIPFSSKFCSSLSVCRCFFHFLFMDTCYTLPWKGYFKL